MIDTHAHLTHLDYNESELKNVIKRMDNNIIIASGTNDSDNKEVIDLVNNYENIYGVIGIIGLIIIIIIVKVIYNRERKRRRLE